MHQNEPNISTFHLFVCHKYAQHMLEIPNSVCAVQEVPITE